MESSHEKAVVFADLSSSATLFERLGDEEATELVRVAVSTMAQQLVADGGTVIKLLGDGMMATFEDAENAVQTAMLFDSLVTNVVNENEERWHDAIETGHLNVRVGIDFGSVIEVAGDVYGDTVNVASRLLALAKPGELMLTSAVHVRLSEERQERCRRLGRMFLRGKSNPELVYGVVLQTEENEDLNEFKDTEEISSSRLMLPSNESSMHIRLEMGDGTYIFSAGEMPITIGRSDECDLEVSDLRVSRTHVRLDWFDGRFFLTDLSVNGTMVQFGTNVSDTSYPLSLRRQRCVLFGSGYIILGQLEPRITVSETKDNKAPFLRFLIEDLPRHQELPLVE